MRHGSPRRRHDGSRPGCPSAPRIATVPHTLLYSRHAGGYRVSRPHPRAVRKPELPRMGGVLRGQRVRAAPRARVRGHSQRRGADRRLAAVQVHRQRARCHAAGGSRHHARRHEGRGRAGHLHALVRRARQGHRRRHGHEAGRAGVAVDGRGPEPALVPAERRGPGRAGRGRLRAGRGAGRARADVGPAAEGGRRRRPRTR